MSELNKDSKSNEPEIRYVPVQFIEGYAPQAANDEVEIDLMDILKRIWDGRRAIIKITIIFALIGGLYAYFTPNEYTTTSKLLPEFNQTNNLGRFGGLAAQFGLGGATTGTTNEVLSPLIYPEILTSTDFLHDLIQKNVYYSEIQDSITIQEFYNNHQKSNALIGYTIGLPFKALALLRSAPDSSAVGQSQQVFNDSFKRISPKEMAAIGALRVAISSSRDQITGMMTVTVNTQSPEVTVQIANHVNEALSEYLIYYRTEKSRQNLTFLEQRHLEARENFIREQERLAAFRDQNQGNLSAAARTIEQNLQSEYNIKFNVYNSITEQLEQARIRLQQDTPVVSVIQDNLYPNRQSAPNRLMTIILSIFLGGILAIMYVVGNPYLINIREKFKTQ